MANELLRLEEIEKEFKVRRGAVKAVSGVSFSIERGETVCLVGESGCGKSTLARLVLGLVDPSGGRVLIGGQDIARARDLTAIRRRMQMVFQDPYASLDPRMTVGQIIAEPLSAHGLYRDKRERRAYVHELMELSGIRPEYYSRYPHQFSGGQRQRVGIARALALKPELVVLDEPVSALDVSIQAQILNLLRDLQAELRLTYLFITHDLSVVRFMSDRVIVMFLGKVCESGRTKDVYSAPKHPYTRLLLSSVPQPDPSLRGRERELLTGEMPSPLNPPPGCRFHTRCPDCAEICRREAPALIRFSDGREAACHGCT